MLWLVVILVLGVPLAVYINQARKHRDHQSQRLEQIQQQLEKKRLADIQRKRRPGNKDYT